MGRLDRYGARGCCECAVIAPSYGTICLNRPPALKAIFFTDSDVALD